MGNNSYLLQNNKDYSSSKTLLEYTHFGYMWTTVKTNRIVASHTVYTLLEIIPFSEFLNEEKWRTFIHPQDLFKYIQAVELLMETGSANSCEYRLITKSGKHIFVNHQMRLSINYENEVKILSVLDDVTEQKHAEVILEVMNEGFFELDNSYKFRRINAKAEYLWNIERNNVINKTIWDVFPEVKNTDFYKLVEKAVTEKTSIAQNVIGPVNNHWLHFSTSPYNDGTIVIFYDIQNEKEAEQKVNEVNISITKKNKELGQRNKELISLSNVASNDLTDPLRRIYTAVEAIIIGDGKSLSNNGRAHLRRIQSSVQKMQLITDDLVSYTSISKEKNTASNSVDLNNVLEDAKKKLKRMIEEKNAAIHAEALPSVKGNYDLLVQLFQNILHNSIKFQRNNIAPEISITVKKLLKENKNYLRVMFKDNGIGFPQNEAENIFNVFTKLNTSEEYRGSGMGLSISKKIMEQHDGLIEAASEENSGTEICCYFPAG